MESLLGHYRMMQRIRLFEEELLRLFREGELRGTAHVCIGQEAVASGACAALADEDYVVSNHRGHGHLIARGADLRRLMAELFCRQSGYSLGRGGSQHISAPEIGFLCSNGITGGGMPLAVGAALSQSMRDVGGVTLCFFGDGAAAQGTFHESLNLAALWKLPVIFVCENNHFAMGTHFRDTCPVDSVSLRAAGYGIPGVVVDGNLPREVEQVVAEARERAVTGGGPFLIEARTYRVKGHSRSDLCGYRCREEEAEWLERDPLALLVAELQLQTGFDKSLLDAIDREVTGEIRVAVDFARKDSPLPPERALDFVYSEPCGYVPECAGQRLEVTYAQALNMALERALDDDSVVLLGEDIADYNGAFRVTRDLYERFGRNRVRNTPISENTFVGAGVGAAMTGMRPVVEIMFMDFLLLALDQIVNHAAKFHYVFGGEVQVPLTVRTPAGGRRGYGATHSQCFESMLMHVPGLKVFAPYSVQDAYSMLLEAIFDPSPVVFVEHKLLYGMKGELDTSLVGEPVGRARVVREGNDLTIVSFSHMVSFALEASDILSKDGVSVEVIDLRSLSPLDVKTVAESACRTQRVLVAEEGVLRGGVGAEVVTSIQDACFGYLDAPVLRVGAKFSPIPTEESLERVVLPQVEDILCAARELLE